MKIIQTVQKWGNGTGIRIPKQVLKVGRIGVGQRVSFEVHKGSIILSPVKEKQSITLEALLKGVDPELVGGEMDWGDDIGNEIYE